MKPPHSAAASSKDHSLFFSGLRNGLFEPKHEKKMGQAVWLFGFYIGRQTAQEGSVGLVLGGKVLTYEWMVDETGWKARTLQRWNSVLEAEGYIRLNHDQHGFSVRILNAKKFSGSPKVARQEGASIATTGDSRVKSGDPQVKSGESGRLYPYMNLKKKAKEKAKSAPNGAPVLPLSEENKRLTMQRLREKDAARA